MQSNRESFPHTVFSRYIAVRWRNGCSVAKACQQAWRSEFMSFQTLNELTRTCEIMNQGQHCRVAHCVDRMRAELWPLQVTASVNTDTSWDCVSRKGLWPRGLGERKDNGENKARSCFKVVSRQRWMRATCDEKHPVVVCTVSLHTALTCMQMEGLRTWLSCFGNIQSRNYLTFFLFFILCVSVPCSRHTLHSHLSLHVQLQHVCLLHAHLQRRQFAKRRSRRIPKGLQYVHVSIASDVNSTM